MRPGEHGQVTVKTDRSRWTAATYVRDPDDRRRRVERSSDRSAEDARRQLQRHLANRRTPLTDQAVTERTSLAELFEVWIDLFPVSRTAGVGCSRRRVGGGVMSFVLDGAAVVQGAVAAHRVVEGLDVFEDRRGQLGAGGPGASVE